MRKRSDSMQERLLEAIGAGSPCDRPRPLTSDDVIELTYGSGRYQLLACLFLGGIYVATVPSVQLQVFVASKIENDPRYPSFTAEAVSGCQSLYFVGSGLGYVLFSSVGDVFGRRRVSLALAASMFLSAFASTLAPDFGIRAYAAALFWMGLSSPCVTYVYLFLQEALPGRLRSPVSAGMNIFYSAFVGIIAIGSGTLTVDWDWRHEVLFWWSPLAILVVASMLFAHESLRFLMATGHQQQAREVAASLASCNGTALLETDWPLEGEALVCSQDSAAPAASSALRVLLGSGPQRFRLAMSSMGWIAANVGYYGLSYSAGSLSDNVYRNTALFAAVDIIGYYLPIWCLPVLGRRGTQCYAFLAAAAALFTCGLLRPGSPALVTFAVAGRLLLDVCYGTVYVFSMETFPTEYRSTAIGLCNALARSACVFAPLFGQLPPTVSCPFFGALCLLAAGATRLLPETDAGPLRES